MEKTFKKHEKLITAFLIIIYVLINFLCIKELGISSYKTVIINFIFSILLIIFIIKNKLSKYYGFTKISNPKNFLYFVPLFMIILVRLLGVINIKYPLEEIIYFILNMICIGFLEEIIFRGFLFKSIEKNNVNKALVFSSIIYGLFHVVNLLNGEFFIQTLVHVCMKIALGYMFVIIFYRSKSLLPCIISHILFNSISLFIVNNHIINYMIQLVVIFFSLIYTLYIEKNYERQKKDIIYIDTLKE